MSKRLQNRIAQSTFTLPTTAIIAAAVSALLTVDGIGNWYSIPLIAVATIVMLEFNNRNVLLRIRSRMVSTTFLFLTMVVGYSLGDMRVAAAQLCVATGTFFIAQTYQNRYSMGKVFYAFACISASSIFYPQLIWLCIVYWIFLIAILYAFSFRALNASLLGILFPYIFYIPYYIYVEGNTLDMAVVTSFYDYSVVFNYSNVTLGMIVNYGFLLLLGILGTIHFLRRASLDKIQTRSYYNMFIAFTWVLLLLIPLAPPLAPVLLPVACVPIAPLVAHYFTLTATKVSNMMFFFTIFLSIVLFIFNQCLTSLSNMVPWA